MANYDLTYEGSRVQGILDTGDELRDAGYIFRGEATPSTVPGTPTERVAYIGGPGTYTNFGSSITVGAGCICVFKYTGSAWSNQVINTGLSDAISSEATTRSQADTALQNAINAINNNIGNGYVYAGVATPSTSPVTGKVFYLAVQAGTYTNFGNAVVTAGLNVLKKNGSAWSVDQVIAIDAEPTQGSANLVKSSGVLNSIIQNGPAFDLSAYNAQGGVLATYADLSAALTALNALPSDFKKGGMSMKFVLSSDNKYVQFRLMSDTFNTIPANWQGVDDEPTAGSDNLVKSGGVHKVFLPKNLMEKYFIDNTGTPVPYSGGNISYACTDYYPVINGQTFLFTGINNVMNIAYYGLNKNFIRRDNLTGVSTTYTLDFNSNTKIVYARFSLYRYGGGWDNVRINTDNLLPYLPYNAKDQLINNSNEIEKLNYSANPLIRISSFPTISESGTINGSIVINFNNAVLYYMGKTVQYIDFSSRETKSFEVAHSRAMYYDIINNDIVLKNDGGSYPSDNYILLADCYKGTLSSGWLKNGLLSSHVNQSLKFESQIDLIFSNYDFYIGETRTQSGSVTVAFPDNETGYLKYYNTVKSFDTSLSRFTIEHNKYLYINIKTCEITIETAIQDPNKKLMLLACHNGRAVDGKLKELYVYTHRDPEYYGERIQIGQKNTWVGKTFVTLSEFGTCQACALYGTYLFVAMSTSELWVFDVTTGVKLDAFLSYSGIHFNSICFGDTLAPNSNFPYLYGSQSTGAGGVYVFKIEGSIGGLSCTTIQQILFSNVSDSLLGAGDLDFGIDFANKYLYSIAHDVPYQETVTGENRICKFNLPAITGENITLGDSDVLDHFSVAPIFVRQGCLFDGNHLYCLRGYGDSELVAIDVNAKRISARVRFIRSNEAEGLAIYDNKLLIVRSNLADVEQITF